MATDVTGPCTASLDSDPWWVAERIPRPVPTASTRAAVPIATHFQGNCLDGMVLEGTYDAKADWPEGGFLPCQISSSSINCWSEAKRALGSRSRHLLTTLLNTGGIDESTSASGTAGSCVRFTRLAIALSA